MLLQLQDINVAYGEIQVLWDMSIEADSTEIVALVGSNGAGKTTTLRTISGLNFPLRGRVLVDGEDITFVQPHRRAGLGIAHVPEGRQLFAGMSVKENLMMGAYSRKDRKEVARDFDQLMSHFPELGKRQGQQAGTLSGGEQQMVAIGRALMGKPKLLLIDELSLGLAPMIVDRLIELIKRIHTELRLGILFVEQDVNLALELANRGYVLENGKVTVHGPSPALLANDVVRCSYLGL